MLARELIRTLQTLVKSSGQQDVPVFIQWENHTDTLVIEGVRLNEPHDKVPTDDYDKPATYSPAFIVVEPQSTY